MRRRLLCSGICCITLALLCACQKAPEPAAPAPTHEPTFEELLSEAEARSQAQAQTPQIAALAGTYVGQLPEVEAEYQPTLTLKEDGTAIFHANLLSAMGDLTGTYTATEHSVTMEVTGTEITGFVGEKVKTLAFDLQEDGSLKLAYTSPITPVGATNEGDVFQKSSGVPN